LWWVRPSSLKSPGVFQPLPHSASFSTDPRLLRLGRTPLMEVIFWQHVDAQPSRNGNVNALGKNSGK